MESNVIPGNVIVVGGGLAGLTAACYLARAGVTVTVLEKGSEVGGLAATQREDGYAFNRGLHALYPGGAASDVLRELGISYSYGTPKQVWVQQGGKLNRFPTDPISLMRTNVLGMRDKLEFIRLFATLPRLSASTLAHLSVQDWLQRTFQRSQSRKLVAAIARTFVYSTALDLVSAEVFVDKLQRTLKHPVQYIDGGWQTLADALRCTAERAGVRIMKHAPVVTVEHYAGRAQGVRLRDGTMLPAAAVVLAVRPVDATMLIDEAVAPALHQSVGGFMPGQVACLDVALRRLPNARHTVVQDLDHAGFLSAQSCFVRIAPEGGALVGIFKQLDPREPSDTTGDQRDLESLLDTVQPGWQDVLVKRVFLPRMTACGMVPTARQGGFGGRPGPLVWGMTNLYLAGDWVGSEGFLVDASFASARKAAQLLLQDGVWETEDQMLTAI